MIIRTPRSCSRGLGDVSTTASSATDTLSKATDWLSSQPWYIVAGIAAVVGHLVWKGRR